MTGGRRAIAVAALLALAACTSGGGGDQREDDPLAPAPTTVPPGAPATEGSGAYGPPVLLGNLQEPAIGESSGLVASRRNPGRYWTHNDSGDDPVLFCLGGGGEACGVWRVTGAEARDWEDIAAGPGPEPERSYLYVGDVGDNEGVLEQVVVYRVPEPEVPAAGAGPVRSAPAATQPAEILRLRYPDGPHNAEAVLVHPHTGDLYVVSKDPAPTVYVARAPLSTGPPRTLERVAVLATEPVTGGDVAPDGRRIALCTYADGYELELPPGEAAFDVVWRQPPRRVTLGARAQREAIAYRLDGAALLTTSESSLGGPAPLQQVERR